MEDVAVTVTHGGYLKRTAVDTYRAPIARRKRPDRHGYPHRRRGRDLVVASTHAYLLVFTTKGRVYWLKIYEIPDAGTTARASTFRA